MRTIFTTGQVAKICKVAPRTVSKWFDSGRLRGYRIPGSQDRRIPREHLIRFLKEHGMPLGELDEEGLMKVLLVGTDEPLKNSLVELNQNGLRLETVTADLFEAGSKAQELHPQCVVIDTRTMGDKTPQLVDGLRGNGYDKAVIIGILDGGTDRFATVPFNERFRSPFDAALLLERITTLVGRVLSEA